MIREFAKVNSKLVRRCKITLETSGEVRYIFHQKFDIKSALFFIKNITNQEVKVTILKNMIGAHLPHSFRV